MKHKRIPRKIKKMMKHFTIERVDLNTIYYYMIVQHPTNFRLLNSKWYNKAYDIMEEKINTMYK